MPNTTPEIISKVLFASRSTYALGHVSDLEIMRIAAKRNRTLNITGLILRGDTWFAEVLEGRLEVLDQLMQRILEDPRHAGINHWYGAPSETRSFPNWHAEHWGVEPHLQKALFKKLHSETIPTELKIKLLTEYGRRRLRKAER